MYRPIEDMLAKWGCVGHVWMYTIHPHMACPSTLGLNILTWPIQYPSSHDLHVYAWPTSTLGLYNTSTHGLRILTLPTHPHIVYISSYSLDILPNRVYKEQKLVSWKGVMGSEPESQSFSNSLEILFIVIVIVNSWFLERPQKRSRRNQLIMVNGAWSWDEEGGLGKTLNQGRIC